MATSEATSTELAKKVAGVAKKFSEDGILEPMEKALKEILQERNDFKKIEDSLRKICEKCDHLNYGEIFHELAGVANDYELENECLDKQILDLLSRSENMQLSLETKRRVFEEWGKIFSERSRRSE